MRILTLAIFCFTSFSLAACGKAPSAADIESTLTTSPDTTVADNSAASDGQSCPSHMTHLTAISTCISSAPQAALTFAAANSACQAQAQTLCTASEYHAANNKGDLDVHYGQPAWYWVVPATSSHLSPNIFFASSQLPEEIQGPVDVTDPHKYFCCTGAAQ